MFIIKEGQAQIIAQNKILYTLKKGEFFGEFNFVDTPREIDVIASSEVAKCLVLIRDIIKKILGGWLKFVLHSNILQTAFIRNHILKDLTQDQIKLVTDSMKLNKYQPGDVVFRKGSSCCDSIHIVVSGSLKNAETQELIKSQVLCETYVLNEDQTSVWLSDIMAEEALSIASITTQKLEQLLNTKLSVTIKENQLIRALGNVSILKSLDINQLRDLQKNLSIVKYQEGEVIVEQGTIGDLFYMIKSGQVEIVQNNVYKLTLSKLDYFGERSLLLQQARSASVIAKGKVTCWTMNSSVFNEVLGEHIRIILLQRVQMQMESISMNDLKCLKVLGSGVFATIIMCKHKEKDTRYILKCINRLTVDKYQLYDKINQERKILQQIDCPFIMKLVKTFKDQERVYFLNEFIYGINFLHVISQRGLMKTNSAQFYAANILLILEYLHIRLIAYRDLKPVNFLCDQQGYLTLIDFRTAKIVSDRTYTLIGTPHYTAPEVIIGKGSGTQVDIWSLGIMIYELICSRVPFGAQKEDPYEIFQEILKHNLKFPAYIQQQSPAKSFIEQCLDPNPIMRSNGNTKSLRSHEFFNEIDFIKLSQKEVQAPYQPNLSFVYQEIQAHDQNNYTIDEIIDNYFELQSEDSDSGEEENFQLEIDEEQAYKATVWDKEF